MSSGSSRSTASAAAGDWLGTRQYRSWYALCARINRAPSIGGNPCGQARRWQGMYTSERCVCTPSREGYSRRDVDVVDVCDKESWDVASA